MSATTPAVGTKVTALRQPTLETLGLGTVLEMFRNGALPANTEALEIALSSYIPPVSILYCEGSLAFNSAIFGASAPTTVSGRTLWSTSARTVRVGSRLRRQTSGNSCSSTTVAN